MNPIEIFQRLVQSTYWWISRQMPSKLRSGEVDTKPGDMINKLSLEERAIIQNLKSEDIAEGKVTELDKRIAAETAMELTTDGFTKLLKEAKLNFDMKLKNERK